jgi:hypothetical protein
MRPAADAPGNERAGAHVVELYEREDVLADAVAGFVGPGLLDEDTAIVVATSGHLDAFEAAMTSLGVNIPLAMAAGRYQSFDAGDLLATIMVDGVPDWTRFRTKLGRTIERITDGGRSLHIYGEMVALLWEAGHTGAAAALEDLWNRLAGTYDFSLLCGYRLRAFADPGVAAAFRHICALHTTTLDQRLLAELAYADAVSTVVNRQALKRRLDAGRAPRLRGPSDSVVLAAWNAGRDGSPTSPPV